MKAFVLGAGLGTRLRPLTDELPKPLVPVFQKPLITFALDHLIAAGVDSFVINTHHLPEKFAELFGGGSYRGHPVTLVHEPILLETGGGMKNAQPLLGEKPFILYSGDLLTDIPLQQLITEHFHHGNDVTLGLRHTELAEQVALKNRRVLDIGNRFGHPGRIDYANVSVWNPEALGRFSLGEKISFIPVLANWIGEGARIGGVVLEEGEWFNLGSPVQYLEMHRTILEWQWRPSYLSPNEWPVRIAPDAAIDPTAQVSPYSAVGPGCKIGANAVVEDSVLWAGAQIAACAEVKRCIVRADRAVEGAHADETL